MATIKQGDLIYYKGTESELKGLTKPFICTKIYNEFIEVTGWGKIHLANFELVKSNT